MSEPSLKIERGEQAVVASSFEGPLPSPDILWTYERILPGLADRIVKMAEEQSANRQKRENKLVYGDSNRAYLGLIFAFIIVVFGIGMGGYLIAKDKPVAGFVALFTPLAVIVGAFIYQKKKKV